MKVEQTSRQISESFGTDDKQKIESLTKQVTKESTAEKPSTSESKDRSELQHQVLGHEAKKEVSLQSQSKAAELTSKLADGSFASDKSAQRFSEATEILIPNSQKNNQRLPDTVVQLRAAELQSQLGSTLVDDRKIPGVDNGKDQAIQIGSKLMDGARNLKAAGEKVVGSGELSRPIDLNDIKGVVSKTTEEVGNVKVDPGKEIDNMKDGDKITVGGGVSVGAGGAKVGAKGNVELSKEGGKYKLSVDGETAASLGVGVGVGGKVEMSFDNAEQAKKAFGLAQSARLKDSATAENLQAGGLTAKDVLKVGSDIDSKKDAEFLKKHLSAVEVRQQWVAEVPGMNVGKLGLPASAGAKAENTVRFEFENGKPKYMILKNSAGVETYPGGKGSVSIEQKVKIDENFPIGKMTSNEMKNDPYSDLTEKEKQSLKKAMDSAEYSVTIEGDMRYHNGTKGTGVRSQIKLSGKAEDFEKPETQKAIRGIVEQGKIKEGLKTIGNNVKVEGKAEVYESSGVEVKSPEVFVGVELQATRQRVLASQTVPSKPGETKTATEAAEDIDRAYEEAQARARNAQ